MAVTAPPLTVAVAEAPDPLRVKKKDAAVHQPVERRSPAHHLGDLAQVRVPDQDHSGLVDEIETAIAGARDANRDAFLAERAADELRPFGHKVAPPS